MDEPIPASVPDLAGVTCVRASTSSGRIDIVAEQRPDVEVGGRTVSIGREDDQLTIDGGSHRLKVRVPVGTELVVGSESGRIEVSGPAGRVAAVTASGRIVVEEADALDARTDTARVDAGRVTGECRVTTVSGLVTVDSVGSAEVSTTSGRIDIGAAVGAVRAHCVSGRIDVTLAAPADVAAETVTGRIRVRAPAGTSDSHRVTARSGRGRVEVVEG